MAGAVGARPSPAKVGNMPIWDARRCLGNDVRLPFAYVWTSHVTHMGDPTRFIANEGFVPQTGLGPSQEFEVDVCSDYPRSISATSWL
jgi:hypothetical protein